MANTKSSKTILLSLIGVGAVAVSGCERDDPPPSVTPPAQPSIAQAAPTAESPAATAKATVGIPGVGSCEPAAELTGMLSRITETADSNGNGEIEKEEAYSAADFLVGGFFFRADKNFDGTVSPEEGRVARTEVMTRSPVLAAVMQRASSAENSAALARMADFLGVEYAKPVTSNEMRDAAHDLVDEVFRLSDMNKNGSLTQGEALQAGWSRARALGSSAFLTYDGNDDKKLTLDELQSALKEPTRLAFQAADGDKDGALTEAEAASALRGVVQRVWLPSAEPIKAADASEARAK